MGKAIQIRVDESLQEILERIRKEVAVDMKKIYGLDEITIHGTLASQILAAKSRGQNFLNFRIKKSGINKGILELM
jgi:hypothetical protein